MVSVDTIKTFQVSYEGKDYDVNMTILQYLNLKAMWDIANAIRGIK